MKRTDGKYEKLCKRLTDWLNSENYVKYRRGTRKFKFGCHQNTYNSKYHAYIQWTQQGEAVCLVSNNLDNTRETACNKTLDMYLEACKNGNLDFFTNKLYLKGDNITLNIKATTMEQLEIELALRGF